MDPLLALGAIANANGAQSWTYPWKLNAANSDVFNCQAVHISPPNKIVSTNSYHLIIGTG